MHKIKWTDSALREMGTCGETVLSTSPYRLTASQDFPEAHYLYQTYGKYVSVTLVYRPERNKKLLWSKVLDALIKFGYESLFKKSIITEERSLNYVYELKNDTDAVLVSVESVNSIEDSDMSTYPPAEDVYSINISATDGMTIECDKIFDTIKSLEEHVEYSKPNNVHLVVSTSRGYDTMEFELPNADINVEINYGKSFKPVHEKIIGELSKKNGKGLVLLHGTPGTGKTHYLRYIASTIPNKKILFVPPFLTDFITSPEMIPFLVENSNSILFIEDAERVVTDRTIGGSSGVSNILNITDGILSEILNIQIVATFNMDKHKIDSALLRKGRLIAEHCFEALSKEDAQVVLDSLGKQYTAEGKMTLTEIYNIDEVEYKTNRQTRIGFGS
jgi:hypothetical protein